MGKSARTKELESKLAKIKAKIKSLKNEKTKLKNIGTKVKNTYNEASSDSLDGQKYSDMYASDQEAITYYSQQLKKYKNDVIDEINANINKLEGMKASVSAELAVSRAKDGDAGGAISSGLEAIGSGIDSLF